MKARTLRKIILEANCAGLNNIDLSLHRKEVNEVINKYMKKEMEQ